jgi:hypothetical protein
MSTEAIVRYGENTPIADAMTRLRESLPDPEETTRIPGFITEEQLARQLGVTLSTVRRWKSRGYGPKFAKIGRRDYCKETAASDFAAALLAEAEDRDRPRRRR